MDCCLRRGGPCDLAITADARIEQTSANTYRITIAVKEVTNNLGIELVRDGQFTFPEDFKLEITECREYPALVGYQIDVSGKTVTINETYLSIGLIID